MSITVKETSQELTPGYNPIVIVLDSTNKSETGFLYEIDIVVNGSTVSNVDLPSNPDGYGVGIYNRHIEGQLGYNINHTPSNIFTRASSSKALYNFGIFEKYLYNWEFQTISNNGGYVQLNSNDLHYFSAGDYINVVSDYSTYSAAHTITTINGTGSITTDISYEATASGTASNEDGSLTRIWQQNAFTDDLLAFNGVLNEVDYIDYDYTDYIMATANSGKFLTNLPDNWITNLNDRFTLNFHQDTALGGDAINKVRIWSNRGVFDITNTYSSIIDNNKLLQLNCGPWNLLNTSALITTISGSQPILDVDSVTYSVQLMNSSSTALSELRTFKLESPCTEFENYRIMFLDRKGSTICLNFYRKSKRDINVKRTTYRKNYGTYNSTSNTWGYNQYDRGLSNLDMDITETITVNSDWVDEKFSAMAEELMKSKAAYHLDENGNRYAINLDTSSMSYKTDINDMLYDYTFKFQYAMKNQVQRS